jgi:hypothetical protein
MPGVAKIDRPEWNRHLQKPPQSRQGFLVVPPTAAHREHDEVVPEAL